MDNKKRNKILMDGSGAVFEGMRQLMRTLEHPLDLKGNIIVWDNLESGFLRIFEPDADASFVQILHNANCVIGAHMIAELEIIILADKKEFLIKNYDFKEGCFELEEAMMNQLEHFANFYDLEEK